MADECATGVAVQHADGSSAGPTASNGVRRDLAAALSRVLGTDAGITSGPRDQVSGPSEADDVDAACRVDRAIAARAAR